MWLSAARLSETGVALARSCLCGVETAIAFAGEKWAFLLCFLVAVVLSVSTGAVHGRAVVMAVSCWPASAVAEPSLVSKSPCHSVQCAKKFALRGLVVGVSAKKFALRAQNGPKTVFSGALGEFFRGNAGGGGVPGELFRGAPLLGAFLAGSPCPAGQTDPPCPAAPSLSPGALRAPGAWRARRKVASRRSGSSAPPTRRPWRSSGTWARSRGR